MIINSNKKYLEILEEATKGSFWAQKELNNFSWCLSHGEVFQVKTHEEASKFCQFCNKT
jgi:hypothetical protein